MITTQSGLEGLKQSYTDNNILVRATLARIAELRHQSEMFTGKTGIIPAGNQTATTALSPCLRQLSILGVTYADRYRRLKVEESISEAMTNENELAKVQEAKEIPAG